MGPTVLAAKTRITLTSLAKLSHSHRRVHTFRYGSASPFVPIPRLHQPHAPHKRLRFRASRRLRFKRSSHALHRRPASSRATFANRSNRFLVVIRGRPWVFCGTRDGINGNAGVVVRARSLFQSLRRKIAFPPFSVCTPASPRRDVHFRLSVLRPAQAQFL